MNFGFDSTLVNRLFKVLEQYYALNDENEKRILVMNSRKETDRVIEAQSEIRILATRNQTEVTEKDKKDLLDKLSQYLGVEERIPVSVFKTDLPFYEKVDLYSIVFSNKIKKYIFTTNNEIYFLDWTNSAIYGVGEKCFRLSPDTVLDYAYFFFDAVKGRHGKFYFPATKHDIPFRLDLQVSEEIAAQISESIQPLVITETTENFILLNGDCFFQDALFRCVVKVDRTGITSIIKEEQIMENLPIAADFIVRVKNFGYEDLLARIKYTAGVVLSDLLDGDTCKGDDKLKLQETIGLLQSLNYTVNELNSAAIKEINDTLNSCVFFIETFVKPGYDEFHYEKEIGVLLSFISQILEINESYNQKP
jgi:hypothetical protein